MTSTGRHLDETQAGIPNAPSERADLYGQSYCERHQGQLPKGRTRRPDIWAHRSRMRSAKEKRALDRGVVPHMGILSESALLRIGISPKGNKVRLTEKETSILRYLYRAGQRPVSRETLLQEVWGYNSGVTTHTLETHIYRLRQKIEKDAAAPAILVTEAGGYKLVP